MDDMHSPSTRQAYDRGWQRFAAWADADGSDPDNSDGRTVARFLLACHAEGLKPNTLRLWRAAVSDRYRNVLLTPDPTRSDDVRDALRRIGRAAARTGRAVKQAHAVTADELDRALTVSMVPCHAESAEQALTRHAEASAVYRLMFDGALRTDEAVRAEWADLGDDPDATTGYRTLHIRTSKTDQAGRGRYAAVSPQAWEALTMWRTMCPTPDGRISTAPTAKALGARITRMGAAAGIEMSGHSLRRGVATELARRGASMSELQSVGGWRSPAMVARYVEPVEASRNAVATRLGSAKPAAAKSVASEFISRSAAADVVRQLGLLSVQRCLALAVSLDAAADHPEVVKLRAEALDYHPDAADCARPGCVGLVLTTGTAARYCCGDCNDRVQAERRNRRKREARAAR